MTTNPENSFDRGVPPTLPQGPVWGVWLVDFGEWLGAAGTATKPDVIILNPHWLRLGRQARTKARRSGERDRSAVERRRKKSVRPTEIALWNSAEGARAEIKAFEPEKYVPGSERVRRYIA